MSSSELAERANNPVLPVSGTSPADHPDARASRARRIFSSSVARVVAGIVVLACSAAAFYRVRELVAMLLLFSALFAVVMITALILWLIEAMAHKAAVRLEAQVGDFSARHAADSPGERHSHTMP